METPDQDQAFIDEIVKMLKKPIVLKPTFDDLYDAFGEIPALGLSPDTTTDYLVSAIKSKDNSEKTRDTINKIMMLKLFTPDNNDGRDGHSATTPDTIRDVSLYLDTFPKVINAICEADPKDLILRSAWLILSTMPSLYEVFCELGFIKNKDNSQSDNRDFEFELNGTKGQEYLDKYLALMAKVVQTDFSQQGILLTRLVQKLGDNVDFLNYVDEQIEEFPLFKNKIEVIREQWKMHNLATEAFNTVMEMDSRIQLIEQQINLIHNEIYKFRQQVLDDNQEKPIKTNVTIANNLIDFGEFQEPDSDQKDEVGKTN
jgi:hypothetical protein